MDTKEKNPAGAKRRPPQRNAGAKKQPSGADARKKAAEKKRAAQQAAARRAEAKKRKEAKDAQVRAAQDRARKQRAAQEKVRKERAAKSAERRRAREAQQRKENKAPSPVLVYTQPQPFNRNRLLIQLATVTAVVLALVLGLSIFFRVEVITVSGAETYNAWTVREASGILEGDYLLTFSRARASAQIRAELPYVDKVRIGIKLPNTVNIYIEEAAVVYSIQSSDGTWWLMTADGRIVEQTDGGTAETYTKVVGVVLEGPMLGEQAVAKEELPTETDPTTGELVPLTTTNTQRLDAALQILSALEANDIVGEAASVDVSNLNDIELMYGTRFQVDLGDTSRMEEKISWMKSVVAQMGEYDSGILDITFTTWQNQVGYTPYE